MKIFHKFGNIRKRSKKILAEARESFMRIFGCKNVSSQRDLEILLDKFQPILGHYNRKDPKQNKLSRFFTSKDKGEGQTRISISQEYNASHSHPSGEQQLKLNQRYGLDVPKLFEGLREKFSSIKSKESIPKWKAKRPIVSLESINSRTSHILSSLAFAETVQSKLKRLEDLTTHLTKYPQAKHHAVKEGAVKFLLNLKQKTKDETTQQLLKEAFAMVGHIDPPSSSGIRILSIDGGGMRGIGVIKMLRKLEEITGRHVYELFDFICGVSTGAIITCCMVPPMAMNMESLHQLYKDLSVKVFQQNTIWGASKLVWSHAYYDTSLWEKLLSSCVGTTSLLHTSRYHNCPKVCVVSTISNHSKITPFLFRNYSVPYLRKSEYRGSSRHTIFEAIRASAAAPTIFEEFRIGELLHQDGGILVNNPTAVALHEVKTLWPDEHISCVVSCGTGRYNPVPTVDSIGEKSAVPSSWKTIFDKILDSATDTEAVHTILNDLLPEDIYYRLNPHLTESISMDEIREEKLKTLENETEMYCRRNYEKFHEVAQKLLKRRTAVQKWQDFVKYKIKLFGY